MKKLLLSLILIVVSSSSTAEWIPVGGNDKFSIYSDPATIIKSGSRVKMLRLTDFKVAQRIDIKYYLSTKRQDEYDCVKEQYRIIYVNAYTENMGGGNVVMKVVNKPDDWRLIPPGSQGEAVWKFACGE
jgi:hypothetical protein